MKITEIYYFSGTGNSLFAAKQIHKRIPGSKILPIVKLLNKDIKSDTERIGIVFPVHLATIPNAVKYFLKKFTCKSSKYIFAAATRIGTTHRCFLDINKILKKKGKKLDLFFNLNMASNDFKFKRSRVTSKEEICKLEKNVIKKLDLMKDKILNQETFLEKDTEYTEKIPKFLLLIIPKLLSITDKMGLSENYFSDSKCTGCGTCEKVCLSKKIKIQNNKPEWQKKYPCYRCYACLNFCPEQAVQIKSTETINNGRYSHPYASVKDIASQK